MFAGHFGLAAGIKALDSRLVSKRDAQGDALSATTRRDVPLWALMLSTQLLDVVFALLLIPGVESFGGSAGYGEGWIHAYYSHSLVGALLIAAAAGALAWKPWGRVGALIVAATVFSHWLLDLLVHRPDLPILPGNLGNLPLLGFGLWSEPAISIALEALLVVGGAAFYFASALSRAGRGSLVARGAQGRALVAGVVMSALLALSLVSSVTGIG
ncbi:MAG: putative membrane protein [Ktedonobacterales bacterium]|jgi:membrane-bound metal-dependent hydrolase YbcI (DUF457 family)|nr:MAG: putative membrane protein [Ktedonobacterales bacterium]